MLKWVLLLAVVAAVAWVVLAPRRRAATLAAAPLSAAEALSILGLGQGASADDIRAAHRRLIAQVHPDAGGSADLANRVNAARDAALAALPTEKNP
jgi:preprotein translocase subunit Sec63